MTSEHEQGPAASGVVRHLVHCRPCRESLATMGDEDAAVAFLEAQRDEPGATTTVDRVLASTATAGTQLVADLIYELAKGCLLSDEEFARLVKPVVAPREVDVVRQELEVTAATVKGVNGHVATACREVPTVLADREEMQKVAQDLLAVLEKVEGKSARKLLVEGSCLISQGEDVRACDLLEQVLGSKKAALNERVLAAINLSRALARLEKYQAVLDTVKRAEDGGYLGPITFLYGLISHTLRGEHKLARQRLGEVDRVQLPWTDADRAQAMKMTTFVAHELDMPVEQINSVLGAA